VLKRALRRAGLAAGRCWRAAVELQMGLGIVPLLLMPFVVLLALSADLLALLLGGMVRATLSCTVSFVVVGIVLGYVVGGDAVAILPAVLGVAGLLLGIVVGFLCGPIFRSLPEQIDRRVIVA
jgi:hypothetical protein